jgi:hypothetical protein
MMLDFMKRRPDFLIAGAQKAGTTALESFLDQHPRIKCAKRKETGFFNRNSFYELGPAWYERQFPHRFWPGTLLFEATPEYLYYPFVARRVFEFAPEIKLLILLRNPVERAYSAWNMFRDIHRDPKVKSDIIRDFLVDANPDVKEPLLELLDCPEFPNFHESAERELSQLSGSRPGLEPSFIQRGLYWEQIERFFSLFPKQNILILESAELKKDRATALNRVLVFLGLPEMDWKRTDLRDRHVRPYDSKMEERTRTLLQEFFSPHNKKLYALLGREFDWDT